MAGFSKFKLDLQAVMQIDWLVKAVNPGMGRPQFVLVFDKDGNHAIGVPPTQSAYEIPSSSAFAKSDGSDVPNDIDPVSDSLQTFAMKRYQVNGNPDSQFIGWWSGNPRVCWWSAPEELEKILEAKLG